LIEEERLKRQIEEMKEYLDDFNESTKRELDE
jgi:hypothetical protein